MTNIETLVGKFFNNFLRSEEVKLNYRPDFLKNEETGKNLELDIYFPKLKFAIEVNGFTHKLKAQKKRDKIKQEKCKELGIDLLTVTHPGRLIKFLRTGRFDKYWKTRKIPYRLIQNIKNYKPNKTAVKNSQYIKRKIRIEYCGDVQDKESSFAKKKAEYLIRNS